MREQAEEKLALINEIKQRGRAVENCQKYGADPTIFYRWEEAFDTFGVESLRSKSRNQDPGIRKLTKEKEGLKKMLAEKELLESSSRKRIKNKEAAILMNEYRPRGLTVTRMIVYLGIPESTYYRKPSPVHLKRGRKVSRTTDLPILKETARVPDTRILADIKELLGRELVCYGYKKVTKCLQRSGDSISRKKVYRIMMENSLLNHRCNYCSPASRVVDSVVRVHSPNEVWEMDIKYICIQGKTTTIYLFAMIDCFTREVVGK